MSRRLGPFHPYRRSSLSPLFARRTKRGLISAAVASAALFALPAIAGAAPSGGAAQSVTGNPDVVSSSIISNTNPLLTSNVCYDTKVQMPSGAIPIPGGGGSWNGAALTAYPLRGYASPAGAVAGANAPTPFGDIDIGDLAGNFPIAAKIDLNNDHCVILQWLPIPGGLQHLDDWTITEADAGAVQDSSFRNSDPGSAALDGSTIGTNPVKAGLITGLNLQSAFIDPNLNRITYTFDRYVGAAAAGLFGFYTQDGHLITGVPGLAVATGKSVVVQFADASAGGASVADAVKVGTLFGAVS